jgi:hypothetical protein
MALTSVKSVTGMGKFRGSKSNLNNQIRMKREGSDVMATNIRYVPGIQGEGKRGAGVGHFRALLVALMSHFDVSVNSRSPSLNIANSSPIAVQTSAPGSAFAASIDSHKLSHTFLPSPRARRRMQRRCGECPARPLTFCWQIQRKIRAFSFATVRNRSFVIYYLPAIVLEAVAARRADSSPVPGTTHRDAMCALRSPTGEGGR